MKFLSNLHTHTSYCDGKNTPREMVQAALNKGFRSLGFSGHSFTPHDTGYCMSEQGTQRYKQEVRELQEAFAQHIDLFLGLENDFSAPQPDDGYDFIIGAVHYLRTPEGFFAVDESEEKLRTCINTQFGGDWLAAVRTYYHTVADMLQSGMRMDILAHFDLIEKFNAGGRLFDSESPLYRRLALEALEAAIERGIIVEVNTGAITRGYTQNPYPARFLLERLQETNTPVTLSADAHAAEHLNAHFDTAAALLRDVGFREVMELTHTGFVSCPL